MNIKEADIVRMTREAGGFDATPAFLSRFAELVAAATRARCIELALAGTAMPVQTRTLEALQRDRKRIAMLIAGDSKDLRALVDSYTMASKE
jgi:NADPH-dependent ferric siderophore reductase